MSTFFSGDGHLSSVELRLWSLVNHVLLQWHTLVIFKYDHINVPAHKRQMISFFVPGDATFRDEIVKFLETELASEAHEDHHAVGDSLPGDLYGPFPGSEVKVSVSIEPFSGLTPYMTNEQVEKMARELFANFMQRVKRDEKDRKEDKEK